MAGKINPYDYEPEYSDDEDIGNVNVDKYEIRNSADVMTRLSDCSVRGKFSPVISRLAVLASHQQIGVSVGPVGDIKA